MPCLSPISKPNPNYGLANVGLNYLKDCDSQMLSIPCGRCANCIAVRQMYMVQRVQMESLKNHLFFATLTYNNEFLPTLEVGDFTLRYANMHDLVLTFKRIQNNDLFPRPWRYLAVSEFGGLKARPHFHVLFMLPKFEDDSFNTCLSLQHDLYHVLLNNWSANVGSKRNPIYKPRCTFAYRYTSRGLRTNYDLHYVNPALTKSGITDCAFYVLKYMLKDSERANRLQQALKLNYEPSDYETIWDIVRPRSQWSKGFGLNAKRIDSTHFVYDSDIIAYLHKCVVDTPKGANYPFYFAPDSGLSFPLCPFYRKIPSIFSVVDAHDIYYNKSDVDIEFSRTKLLNQLRDFKRKLDLVQSDDLDDSFDSFFD